MQLNTPQQDQSPSLIDQDLPSYQNRMYLSSFHDDTTSNQFSFNYMQKLINPFEGTTLQEQYKRFEQLKSVIFNQRNKLIKDFQLQNTNREAISTLPNYEQKEQQIRQENIKVKELEQDNQQLRQKLRDIQLRQKKLAREKRVYEEVAEFQTKLKGKIHLEQRGKLLQVGDDSVDYNQLLLKELTRNLKSHSQSTLSKLKPYLQYSLNSIKQANQTHQKNYEFLLKRKQKYDHQIDRLKQPLMKEQERNKKYQLEDQIEDQMAFKRQIKMYRQQNKKDQQVRLNKWIAAEEGDY